MRRKQNSAPAGEKITKKNIFLTAGRCEKAKVFPVFPQQVTCSPGADVSGVFGFFF
jgi:hypothetical protein